MTKQQERVRQMLIFFDIDGTMIDEETKLVPESAVSAVLQARENGHVCVINTGRSKRLVDICGDWLHAFDGFLMGCGTQVIFRGEELLHRTFETEEGERIIEALRHNEIDAVLEGAAQNYVERTGRIFHSCFAEYIRLFEKFHYGSYEEAIGHFDKFYAYAGERERMDRFASEVGVELEVVDRGKGYFEIMPAGYTKATGMRFLSDRLGIPMEQTVAIGDSSNDIPMIKCAAIGIAMGNATEDVKQLADFVTTSVGEDGIRNALLSLGAI